MDRTAQLADAPERGERDESVRPAEPDRRGERDRRDEPAEPSDLHPQANGLDVKTDGLHMTDRYEGVNVDWEFAGIVRPNSF